MSPPLPDVRVFEPSDDQWPDRLARTKPAVKKLFVRGGLDLSRPAVAVVGSRHATQYGLSFAADLAGTLAGDGFTIVSGGALGIDGAAHRGALERGRTIVVLGGGLDRPYPPQHVSLFEEVVSKGGALISEAPFGTPPFAGLFPRRNRIIAALSHAVIVVQAARGSGSLITARVARQLGVPVFAVPGAPGDAVSEGTKDLLRSGALLCLGPEEIRRALGREESEPTRGPAKPATRKTAGDPVLDQLRRVMGVSPRPLDDLAQAASLSPRRAAIAVTRLELMGMAARAPGGGYFSLPKDAP
jgi:DNA processing protein